MSMLFWAARMRKVTRVWKIGLCWDYLGKNAWRNVTDRKWEVAGWVEYFI